MSEATPFHAPESEAIVVSAILETPEHIPKVLPLISPDDFYDPVARDIVETAATLHARGVAVDAVRVAMELGTDDAVEKVSPYVGAAGPMYLANFATHAATVGDRARARRLSEVLGQAQHYLRTASYSDGGLNMADRLAAAATKIYQDRGLSSHVPTGELIDGLLNDALVDQEGLVDLPWPKLNEQLGPLVKGEVIGVTAYSGGGKSTLGGNMWRAWNRMGVPVIYFSTEMGTRMAARVAAADSVTSQFAAEKGVWGDRESLRSRYIHSLESMRSWPFELVPTSNITVDEIIRRMRVLRQRWAGRTVVVFVDHMHRLDYGREEPNKAVGPATKAIINAIREDDDGMIGCLLYQPRKPENAAEQFRPVAAHQIRGDSTVWNELDIHISPFRTIVQTDPSVKTLWGTPATRTVGGVPQFAPLPKPGADLEPGTKVSEEHVFISIDKRRVAVPGAKPTVFLNFHTPSGRISQGDPFQEEQTTMEVA